MGLRSVFPILFDELQVHAKILLYRLRLTKLIFQRAFFFKALQLLGEATQLCQIF